MDNLEETGKFLEMYNLQRLNQQEEYEQGNIRNVIKSAIF